MLDVSPAQQSLAIARHGCRNALRNAGEHMIATSELGLETLASDPRYQRLVRRRGRLSWLLTALMLAAYLGFILLVAFAKPLLARPIAGGATTLGIPLGLGVIAVAIVLTGFYVRRANAEFDHDVAALVGEYRP